MPISITALDNTLKDTRETLLSAANGDGMVSRADLERLLEQTENPNQRDFMAFFYEFLIKLEDRPNMRVTEDVIDRGIKFIQQGIIRKFEIKTSFTVETNQNISYVHEDALPLAQKLIKVTGDNVILTPREVSKRIAELQEGLFFDDFGSEAGIQIESIFLEHPHTPLTPTSFVTALGLQPGTPQAYASRFRSAEEILHRFIEYQKPDLVENARAIVELMMANLSDLTAIVLGEEFLPEYESNHPTYVVGMGLNGNLAGFESSVIWT